MVDRDRGLEQIGLAGRAVTAFAGDDLVRDLAVLFVELAHPEAGPDAVSLDALGQLAERLFVDRGPVVVAGLQAGQREGGVFGFVSDGGADTGTGGWRIFHGGPGGGRWFAKGAAGRLAGAALGRPALLHGGGDALACFRSEGGLGFLFGGFGGGLRHGAGRVGWWRWIERAGAGSGLARGRGRAAGRLARGCAGGWSR
jgi:hypothetical protein